MTDYLFYSKAIKFELTHNGLIVLCEDGSIYRIFYSDNNQEITEVIIKPIYQTVEAKKFFEHKNDPNAGKIQTIQNFT